MHSARRVDDTLLHGAVTKLVDTTLQAAHKGVDKVREHLPTLEQSSSSAMVPNFVITSTGFEKVRIRSIFMDTGEASCQGADYLISFLYI